MLGAVSIEDVATIRKKRYAGYHGYHGKYDYHGYRDFKDKGFTTFYHN